LKLRLPSLPGCWLGDVLSRGAQHRTSIDDVASEVGMSRRAFTRHFQSQTGCTFSQWKRLAAVQRATEMLAEGQQRDDDCV
jgi:AraC-like DNA-binding protein